MSKQGLFKPFTYTVAALGAATCLVSAYRLPGVAIDLRFLLLTVITIFFGSRLTIQIPRAKVHYSVSDTLVFLTLLLYGGEAAVLLAAAEALYASFSFRRKGITIRADGIIFNVAVMACSTFLTVSLLELCFGPVTALVHGGHSATFLTVLCVMAVAQFIANSSMAAVYTACETNQGIWQTWNKHYFCVSVTYFAGALAAGVLAKLIGQIDIYAITAMVVFIIILYSTYRRYIEDIKASAAQAEQAEHARAEMERERAEQAEQHVAELSRHIAEQERISRALQESEEHFRYAAFHDALTKLPNRALLTEHLQAVIEQAKQHEDYQFALLFLDLDRFKNINDSLGHSIGDQLLIAMARRLEHAVRAGDTVTRLGGDEFAILLRGTDNATAATDLAARVQAKLEAPFSLSGHEVYTTASIGIALSSTGYEHPENILRDADTAMYRAKAQGKARYEVFDKVMHARAVDLLQLENDLRRAIERDEFRVYYQPIVALETGQLHGFEALVRWQHPERGLVGPTEFITVAEDTGLIVPLSRWVLREACRQLCQWQWQAPANRALTMSVNLSGKQFMQADLVEHVKDVLQATHLEPQCLKLEITESVVMENAELAIAMLNQLKALGVQLSIDDFGTGYSSLSYLHRFPVDTLKIDRSFVSRMGDSDENLEIVRTIKTLASNIGMEVVAEGVEALEQLTQLRLIKCEYGQGYLFSKPVEADAAGTMIAKTPHWLAGAFHRTEPFALARTGSTHLRPV